MSRLSKQLLAVVLALQTSLSGISTIVHAEEPEETYEIVEENVDLYEMFSIPVEEVMDIDPTSFDTILQDVDYFYYQLNSNQQSLYKKSKECLCKQW